MESTMFLQIFIFWFFLQSSKAGLTGPSQREEMMMTDTEAAEFEKFKTVVLPMAPNKWMKLDIGLMKYFTTAGRNADAAIQLFKESLKFRLDSDGYKMTDEVKDYGNSAVPSQRYTDKFGRIVSFFKAKRANFSNEMENNTIYKWGIQYLWSSVEEGSEQLAEKHKKIKNFGFVTILDTKDAKLDDALTAKGLALITKLLKQIDTRFPRTWQYYMIVNAPPPLVMSFAFIKNAMSEYTKSVVFMFEEDDTVWAPLISQFMDIELLTDLYQKSKDVELAPSAAADQPSKGPKPPIPAADMGNKVKSFAKPFAAFF